MSSISYGNDISGIVSYDNQYRITGIQAGTVMNLGYPSFDPNGNIQSITDGIDTTKSKAFAYDTLDRLETATSTGIWGSLAWTYDGVGNRQAENANTYTDFANSNKLNTANGISFGYDNNGNTTTEASRQYIYNQNQRLIQVNNGGTTAYYSYNGNGQRVKKNVNGTITIFHYSLTGQIVAESNSSGTITAEYVYLNGQPLAKIEGANTYYYHNDHLGTPQKMTDASGTVVWAADYKPFGEATITVSTITNNLRFPGQYYDVETGLNYNYFRDYNPVIGRYIEADPVGIERGKNHLYLYTRNNPVIQVDPKGLKVELCTRPVNDPWAPPGVPHFWLKTGTKEAGLGPQGCGNLPGSPFGKPTQICDHTGQSTYPGASCTELGPPGADCVDETCVNNELANTDSQGGWSPTNNCLSLVAKIVKKCFKSGGEACCKWKKQWGL